MAHRLQVLIEAGLIAFSNACFEFEDEGLEEAQHGILVNLPKSFANHYHAFRRLLMWGFARRRLLAFSLCYHDEFLSASTPRPAHQPCALRGRLERGARSAEVEGITSATLVEVSLM